MAYFTAGFLTVLALGATFSVGVLLFRGLIESYVGAQVSYFVVIMLLTGLFATYIQAALQGEHLVHVAGLLEPVKIGARSLIQLALVVAGFSLAGLLAGWAVGAALIGFVGLTYLSIGFERPRRRHFESIVDYAKFSWLGNLRGRAYNDVDVLVLGALVPASLVGVYAVAWSIANFLILFGNAVSDTLFPEISRADASDRETTVAGYVTDALSFAGLFIIPGLVGGSILAGRILRIYGDEFTQGTVVFSLLVLAVLFYTYKKQLLNTLNAIDRPDIAFRINAIFIVTNVILNIVLVVLIGFVGAAIATAVSTGLGLVLAFVALRPLVGFTVPVGEIARQFAAAGLMGVVVLGGHLLFDLTEVVNHNAAITVFLVGVGGGVYFLALLGLSERFRETVMANSPVDLPIPAR